MRNAGKLPLWLNGRPVDEAEVRSGDVLQVGTSLLCLVQDRPARLPAVDDVHPFGTADPDGWVGEGAASWELRRHVHLIAQRSMHVLVTGPSGSGKELVARGVHRRSKRPGAFVARNASTIPESLADAELFGNRANYPNPNTPQRPGLIGAADRGVLFLDELGELPEASQARLLRVLDDGEYTRLGESQQRVARLRVLGATNRDPQYLKHDLLARFPVRVRVPGLSERREDIPLLVHHLLGQIQREDPAVLARFLSEDGVARVDFGLLAALVSHPYRAHVRELASLLWHAILHSPGDQLTTWDGFPLADGPLTSAVRRSSDHAVSPRDPDSVSDQELLDALEAHQWKQAPTWRELGLSSRHVLGRLIRKRGLQRSPPSPQPSEHDDDDDTAR